MAVRRGGLAVGAEGGCGGATRARVSKSRTVLAFYLLETVFCSVQNRPGKLNRRPIWHPKTRDRGAETQTAAIMSAGETKYHAVSAQSLCALGRRVQEEQGSQAEAVEAVEAVARSHGVRVIRDARGDAPVGRLLFSNNRTEAPDEVYLQAQAHGLAIDAEEWALLAVPPRKFVPNPRAAVVDEHLAAGRYEAIQVTDGTVVTIYPWRGGWHVASSNSLDLAPLRYRGPRTYAQILYELLKGHTEVRQVGATALDFPGLDEGRCYTVVFRHYDLHGIREDAEGVWGVQSTDLATGETSFAEGIPGVPRQATFDPAALLPVMAEAEDWPAEGAAARPPTHSALRAIFVDAEPRAKAIIAGKTNTPHLSPAKHLAALFAGGEGPAPWTTRFDYGLILRSRDVGATARHSDILILSPLLEFIRRYYYQRPPYDDRARITADNCSKYYAMRSFLNIVPVGGVTPKREFFELFHWAAGWKAQFENFVESLILEILHAMRIRRQQGEKPSAAPAKARGVVGVVADGFVTSIRENPDLGDLDPGNVETRSILRDLVMRPDNAMLFITALEAREKSDA